MSKVKRPHYFTLNEDTAILSLFSIVSTEKLSILMNLSSQKIINRYQYLQKKD